MRKYRLTINGKTVTNHRIWPIQDFYCQSGPRHCLKECAINKYPGEGKLPFACYSWSIRHPDEAARLMGAEIVEDITAP